MIFRNGSSRPPQGDLIAQLEEVYEQLSTLPPNVTQIDAPSTLIQRLRVAVSDAAPWPPIHLHVDNDLPLRTIRVTWSNGDTDLIRL